jgi:hypothetical protein
MAYEEGREDVVALVSAGRSGLFERCRLRSGGYNVLHILKRLYHRIAKVRPRRSSAVSQRNVLIPDVSRKYHAGC